MGLKGVGIEILIMLFSDINRPVKVIGLVKVIVT